MTTQMLITIGIFAGLQTINVILNSLKTLIMAKTDNPHLSAGINALTFGFYAIVVNQIAHLPLEITVPATVVTNVIGVYATYWIFNKAKKDSLWKIEVYAHLIGSLMKTLEENDISFFLVTPNVIQVYCYKQAESDIVNNWIKSQDEENNVRYNIVEIKKTFGKKQRDFPAFF